MSENIKKLDKDKPLIKNVQDIQVPKLTIQQPRKTYLIVFILIVLYTISFFFELSFSDLLLFWAIITPYSLYLINYFHNKDIDQKRLIVFIQEIKELLYAINFLINSDAKSSMIEKFNLLKEFKKELRKLHCYLIEKKSIPTLLIYTNKGKYEANKDNITQVYPINKGIKSILNQDNPLKFINKIINELQKNL